MMVFGHRQTKVNAMNELTSLMADMSGAVVVELKYMTDKSCPPTMRWSPLALGERVKCSEHIAAGMPGSYHGQDSSWCRQLPSRSSRGEEVVVLVEYVTRAMFEERCDV
jgi:hypothetical protein